MSGPQASLSSNSCPWQAVAQSLWLLWWWGDLSSRMLCADSRWFGSLSCSACGAWRRRGVAGSASGCESEGVSAKHQNIYILRLHHGHTSFLPLGINLVCATKASHPQFVQNIRAALLIPTSRSPSELKAA